MKARNTCYIWFHKPGFGLDEAATVLAKQGLTVERQDDVLRVAWGDGPLLFVRFVAGKDMHRRARARRNANLHATQLRGCDAEFEITFEDLNAVLDEINTLIEVQATLQNETEGFSYNKWNSSLQSAAESRGE